MWERTGEHAAQGRPRSGEACRICGDVWGEEHGAKKQSSETGQGWESKEHFQSTDLCRQKRSGTSAQFAQGAQKRSTTKRAAPPRLTAAVVQCRALRRAAAPARSALRRALRGGRGHGEWGGGRSAAGRGRFPFVRAAQPSSAGRPSLFSLLLVTERSVSPQAGTLVAVGLTIAAAGFAGAWGRRPARGCGRSARERAKLFYGRKDPRSGNGVDGAELPRVSDGSD